MPSCTGCQTKNIAMPTNVNTTVEMMGTKREPPKNDSAWGSWIL